MAENLEKRSIVLTTEIAATLDQMALTQGRSFASLVRDALKHWIATKHVDMPRVSDTEVSITFSKEERKLLEKLASHLSVDPAGILKRCWKENLQKLLEEATKCKNQIDEMNKKI